MLIDSAFARRPPSTRPSRLAALTFLLLALLAAPSPAGATPPPVEAAAPVDAPASVEAAAPDNAPPSVDAAAPASTPPSVEPAAAPVTQAESNTPIDVAVVGPPRPPGATSLGKAELRVLPGAFGDAFRAVEALPGVTPVFSGIPYFYVRGAPPGNVGYFVDGVRVPVLFHFLGGPAVVPPSLIQRVELFPGGYPAEYGRFAGGIVAGETRAPSPELRAEANVRLIDAGAVVEAPLPGGLGSAMAGARYSYTAPVLSLFVPNVRFEYWDYQGRVALDLSSTERLTLFAFGSHDDSAQRMWGQWVPIYGTEFHRVDLRYDRRIGEHTQLQQALTFGVDRTGPTSAVIPGASSTMVNARTRVTHRVNDAVLVRAGVNAELTAYEVDMESLATPFDTSLFPDRQDIAVGVFADAVLDVGRGVQITPGARVDLWGSRGATALSGDVRLAVRVPVTPRVRLIDTLGLVHQAPAFAIPVPGIAIGGLQGGLQKSFQTSAGVEADLPLDITGSLTFFHNAFFDLSDPMGLTGEDGTGSPTELGWLNQRALGSAIGMELHLRRKLTKQIGGFIAYTLSRSSRHMGQASFAAQFDRTHVLQAALSWDIGRGFRVGSRIAAYSGMPIDPFYTKAKVAAAGLDRLPGFFRLDARAEKRWTLGERRWISLVAEVQNATLSEEPNGLECHVEPEPRCEPGMLGPITLPSLGVEGGI